ncbi:MAG: hypothetical protein QOC81_2400 [Thermoanaerobaculia bacterium]|jgi:hypothetical protein|nr:hypothetical protein [Thermoanaerobaculia bacterium]
MTPTDPTSSFFAIVSRDESWTSGAMTDSRQMHGVARQNGNSIEAVDARDERLAHLCAGALESARASVSALREARVRMRVRATREGEAELVETTIIVGIDGLSIVTTPEDVHRDYELLMGLAGSKQSTKAGRLPIVWRNGSAAVLLHEAIGHANEHGAAAVAWPSWLSVDTPIALRRETFRDLPLPRMTHLIARQSGAPFALPDERIDVQLVAGGGYDPLTDAVTIDVAVSTAGPFTIRCTRAQIAASLVGASGDPVRYPGVICSREGQALYVASHAPLMVTGALL